MAIHCTDITIMGVRVHLEPTTPERTDELAAFTSERDAVDRAKNLLNRLAEEWMLFIPGGGKADDIDFMLPSEVREKLRECRKASQNQLRLIDELKKRLTTATAHTVSEANQNNVAEIKHRRLLDAVRRLRISRLHEHDDRCAYPAGGPCDCGAEALRAAL